MGTWLDVLVCGRDYWVAHPVDERTHGQTAPAWIVQWYPDDSPVPVSDDIERMWGKYGTDCTRFLAEREAQQATTQNDIIELAALADDGIVNMPAPWVVCGLRRSDEGVIYLHVRKHT